jgi:hypothetical protein
VDGSVFVLGDDIPTLVLDVVDSVWVAFVTGADVVVVAAVVAVSTSSRFLIDALFRPPPTATTPPPTVVVVAGVGVEELLPVLPLTTSPP